MFENGILNLSNLDNIKESAEFADGSYATKDVSNHIDDPNISIPGGLKEKPSKDNITMTSKEYENMIDAFQKSFKEAAELMNSLKSIHIVEKSNNSIMEKHEDAMYEAMMKIYDDGPIYEAVDRSDKSEVKDIVSKIRKDVKKICKENKISYYEPNKILRVITNTVLTLSPVGGLVTFWSERMWQIVGVINIEEGNIEEGNIEEVKKILNNEFKDDLGEYKLLFNKAIPSLRDIFIRKFNWKNVKETYFLLVDKKLPSELKKLEKEAENNSGGSMTESVSSDKMSSEFFSKLFKKKDNNKNDKQLPTELTNIMKTVNSSIVTEASKLFDSSDYGKISNLKKSVITSLKGEEFRDSSIGTFKQDGDNYDIEVSDPPSWYIALDEDAKNSLKKLYDETISKVNELYKDKYQLNLYLFTDNYNIIIYMKIKYSNNKSEEVKESSDLKELYDKYSSSFSESGIKSSILNINDFTEAYNEYANDGDISEFTEKRCNNENCNGSDCKNNNVDTIKALYKTYKETCAQSGSTPMSFAKFKNKMNPVLTESATYNNIVIQHLNRFFDENI